MLRLSVCVLLCYVLVNLVADFVHVLCHLLILCMFCIDCIDIAI